MSEKSQAQILLERYWEEASNQGNYELVRELCANPIIRHDVDGGVTRLSHDEQIARVKMGVEDFGVHIDRVITHADDTYVTSIWETKSAKDEKPILDQWIRAHENDPMYRFGSQQFGNPIDPSSQTEDLGDDAIKASLYGIENLKKIVPNLNKWTYDEGEDFQELEDLYAQIFNQYNRYMGHVIANIGGVYENYKTFDQPGSVYSHVVKNHQKQCMKFLNEQLFKKNFL